MSCTLLVAEAVTDSSPSSCACQATLLGTALNCRISTTSSFDRKHYFYADLPKGCAPCGHSDREWLAPTSLTLPPFKHRYQTSQYDIPVAEDGWLEARLPEEDGGGSVRVRVSRAHMEEDSGKLVHAGSDSLSGSTHSLADYNRAGTPLVEVVTAPDMRTGKEAAAYAAELQRVVRFLGVSDGNMAEGSFRCDVNISVRPVGSSVLGTKVEVKNLNSFSAISRAVDWEIQRQVGLIEAGKATEVVQETRTWDEGAQKTRSMRTKEGLADYRYFPEPDLLPLTVTPAALQATVASMPELPAALRARYEALGLPAKDVLLLADAADVAAYFDAVCAAGADPRGAANWIMGDLTAYAKQEKLSSLGQLKLTPAHLAELLALVADGTISGKIAKDLLPDLLAGGASPKALVQQRGLVQISDTSEIEALVDAVLAANPGQVAEFRAGKDKLKGFFVGQIMKQSGGKANPLLVEKLLMPKLRGDAA